jgi:prevent-host-death family protein
MLANMTKRVVSISRAKNELSALLDRVRAGERIVITDRGVPVAVLEPVLSHGDAAGRLERLARAGLLRRATAPSSDLLEPLPRAVPTEPVSVVDALINERRASW